MKNLSTLFYLSLAILALGCVRPKQSIDIPPRDPGAITGSSFMEKISGLSVEERDKEIYKEISTGNIPESHHIWIRMAHILSDANGEPHLVELEVLPDFLAIGSDMDFCRMPMMPGTAQRIADLYGAMLPTSKISDLIYYNATVKIVPHPMIPDETMITVPVFAEHNRIIEEERRLKGEPLTTLMAGHKKDVVVSNHLTSHPQAVVIYGWHNPDGKPIQPLYAGHTYLHVDYSHGIRLVKDKVWIDEKEMSLRDILKDPVLYKLVSDEDRPMEKTEYLIP